LGKRMTLGILFVVLLMAGLCIALISEGLDHVEPAFVFREAYKDFQNGLVIDALKGYATASIMSLDAGMRWKVAEVFISRVRVQEARGQLKDALAYCATAVRILHGYDDEGALSYHCTVIENEINRQKAPTP
jgi:hypothetical protein